MGHPLAVAVGECGLDYNRNFSSQKDQIHAFRQQLLLACELNMPLFLHEREAHEDLIQVLDDVREGSKTKALPPIVIHCYILSGDITLDSREQSAKRSAVLIFER